MNCTDIRERFPDLLYETLPFAELEQLNDHLAHCSTCKSEFASLRDLHRALDSVAAPDVSVNLPTLYRRVADLRQRSVKRWRRAALAVGCIAAAVIAVLAFRLEIRVGSDQVMIRWGNSIPVPDLAANGKSESVRLAQSDSSNSPASELELQPMRGLIYALADDLDKLAGEVEARDRRQQQAVARLQENLAQVRLIMQRQLNARQVALDSSKKGEDQ
jgi:hypothetical protein